MYKLIDALCPILCPNNIFRLLGGSLDGLHIKLNKELGDDAAAALELSKAPISTLVVSQCGLSWVGASHLLGASNLKVLHLFGNQLSQGLDEVRAFGPYSGRLAVRLSFCLTVCVLSGAPLPRIVFIVY